MHGFTHSNENGVRRGCEDDIAWIGIKVHKHKVTVLLELSLSFVCLLVPLNSEARWALVSLKIFPKRLVFAFRLN